MRNAGRVYKFFTRTFYGFQYGNMGHMKRVIDEVLDDLKRWEMIKDNESTYLATKLGSRVSELYIDPLSAKWMIDSIPNVVEDLDILFMICNTLEMRPYVRTTADAEDHYAAYLHTHKKLMLREFNPMDYVNAVPAHRVAQIHIAGHSKYEKYILDTHDHPVIDPVWQLYARAIERCGPTPTLLEWDDHIPTFDEVHAEAKKAERYLLREEPELVGAAK